MSGFKQNIIRDVVGKSDKNKDRRIDSAEKRMIQENIRIAERLYRFSAGSDNEKNALNRAIDSVAAEYEGLSAGDIKKWIAEEAQAPVPEFEASSRRLGKPPARTDVHKAWERLNMQQKKEALMASQEALEVNPAQQRRLQQLQLIVTAMQASQEMYGKGHNILEKGYIGLFMSVETRTKYQWAVNDFIRGTVPKIAGLIIQKPDTPLKQILKEAGAPNLYKTFAEKGIYLDECTNSEQVILQYTALVRELRKLGDYQRARYICEDLLSPELDQVFKKDGADGNIKTIDVPGGNGKTKEKVYWDLYLKAELNIGSKMTTGNVADELKKQAPHLTPAEAESKARQYIDGLIYQDYLHKKHGRLLGIVHDQNINQKWSPAKQKLWEEYKDNMGIGALDLADESWDMIIEELVVNAPLIILSGGIASGTRVVASKAISAGAKAVLGVARFGSIAARAGRAGRLAGRAAGLAVEGLAFEMTNAGLHGEWLFKAPDWAQRIMWTTVTLGMFKGAGKLGDALVGKKGVLNAAVSKISNQYIQKGVKELLIKGHLEVAAMMIMGAIQNGVYNGNLDDFIENFGEELFHAYVSVGALKIAGKGVETGKKFLGYKETGDTDIYKRLEKKLEDPKLAEQEFNQLLQAKEDILDKELDRMSNEGEISLKSQDISKLSLEKKIKLILNIKDLNLDQKRAILRSHFQGTLEGRKIRTGKGNNNSDYTHQDLVEKVRILAEKDNNGKKLFNRNQRRLLIKLGITGDKAEQTPYINDSLISELYPRGIESELSQSSVIGDCYFLGGLKSLKNEQPYLMKVMFSNTVQKVANDTWRVSFLGLNIEPILVTEHKIQEWQSKHHGVQAAKGDVILEVAYASYRSRQKSGRQGQTMYRDSMGKLAIEGGLSHDALLDLMGPLAKEFTMGEYYVYDIKSLSAQGYKAGATIFFENTEFYQSGEYIVAAYSLPHIKGDKAFTYVNGHKIYYSHAYSIVGYNNKTKEISLANPHDSSRPFTLSLHDFINTFAQIAGIKVRREGLKALPAIGQFKAGEIPRNTNVSFRYTVPFSIYLGKREGVHLKVSKTQGEFYLTALVGTEWKLLGKLPQGQTIIGRTGNIRLDNNTVSAQHITINISGDIIIIKDNNSSNGTFLGGG